MKVVYEKPVMDVQCFMANEFCSTCGEHNKVYKFTCDAESHSHIGKGGKVYEETNGEPGLQIIALHPDTYRSTYRPCGETHEAPAIEGNFIKGYLTNYAGGDPIDVIIWTGLNDDNTHCTTKLNMDEWETAKS